MHIWYKNTLAVYTNYVEIFGKSAFPILLIAILNMQCQDEKVEIKICTPLVSVNLSTTLYIYNVASLVYVGNFFCI